ncbi:MAG TPA: DUF819 family protein [Chthoniobacterales bacterium]|jgi:uncharacterized membrane protein|nr:DUF819 family protein [Chthoniobacterales bacterium]
MPFVAEPLYVAAVLCLLVAFAEWLSRRKLFTYLGSALIVILAAAILSNTGLLPSPRNAPALYDGVFNYIAPLAIFFLLLDVKLRDLRQAGLPMLLMFSLGAVATMAGVLLSYHFIAPQLHGVERANAVAGMFTGTYIGGSVNLNAVALQYGVGKNGILFAAINAADNIITTIWIIATLLLPRLLQRFWPRKIPPAAASTVAAAELEQPERTSVIDFSILLALGLGSLFASQLLSRLLPALPYILTLTTVALALAQLPAVQRLGGAKVLGYFTVLIFLAVIGAYCDLGALIANGAVAGTLLAWVTAIVFIHALILFVIGGLLKQDWAILSVASNANIGGATSAGVLAIAIGRGDLRLPGILAGSLGNALGTYAGFIVAELLK